LAKAPVRATAGQNAGRIVYRKAVRRIGWMRTARPSASWPRTRVRRHSRRGDVAEAILGRDYDGTLTHDGYSPYDRVRAHRL
jgi:hypothetical protein